MNQRSMLSEHWAKYSWQHYNPTSYRWRFGNSDWYLWI